MLIGGSPDQQGLVMRGEGGGGSAGSGEPCLSDLCPLTCDEMSIFGHYHDATMPRIGILNWPAIRISAVRMAKRLELLQATHTYKMSVSYLLVFFCLFCMPKDPIAAEENRPVSSSAMLVRSYQTCLFLFME